MVLPGFPSHIVLWNWEITPGIEESKTFTFLDAGGDDYDPGVVTAKAKDGTISATVTGTGNTRTITWSAEQTALIPATQWRLNFDGGDQLGGRIGIAQPEDDADLSEAWTIQLPAAGEGLTVTVAGGSASGTVTRSVPLTAYADVGSTELTWFEKFYDGSTFIGGTFAAHIDFGGGTVIATTGTAQREMGFAGWGDHFTGMLAETADGTTFRHLPRRWTGTTVGALLGGTQTSVRVGTPAINEDATPKAWVESAIATSTAAAAAALAAFVAKVGTPVRMAPTALVTFAASDGDATVTAGVSQVGLQYDSGDSDVELTFTLAPTGCAYETLLTITNLDSGPRVTTIGGVDLALGTTRQGVYRVLVTNTTVAAYGVLETSAA